MLERISLEKLYIYIDTINDTWHNEFLNEEVTLDISFKYLYNHAAWI